MELSGPIFWLLAVGGGVIVFGLAMAYGMSRNRSRTPVEKQVTEAASRTLYRAEDRDAS